jgi:hypothetical protein
MASAKERCMGCKKIPKHWWILHNYYGLTGSICDHCYQMVEHDRNGNPVNSLDYTFFLLKHKNN